MQQGQAGQQQFEQQAMFAEVGGSGSNRGPLRMGRSKKQWKGSSTRVKGKELAERAKSMTDSEWESVTLEDKHAFTQYVASVLRDSPTQLTEQQRRRYFETTMVDPRDLDPTRTVRDSYERLKMGMPVQLTNPQRQLGVAQAMYDAGDASMFDPENVNKLENAMTHLKQVFSDYVKKKREGVSTEMERRQLANLAADLSVETQRHLANTFKYAEERLRKITLEERQRQMEQLHAIKEALTKGATSCSGTGVEHLGTLTSRAVEGSQRVSRAGNKKMERGKALLHRSFGLDLNVAESILVEMRAQENFLQFCEVFARLTLGRGFTHTAADESLDEYTAHLRRIYSVDAKQLATIDLVQYLSAKDNAEPVEWAKRWYETALLIPLQNTPEYQELEAIRKRDVQACEAMSRDRTGGSHSEGSAERAETHAAQQKQQGVVNLVEKMFLSPHDSRLASIHERRLRYLAYLQMESQIKRVRANAKLFHGVELLPEADECRRLYQQLLEKKQRVLAEDGVGRGAEEGTTSVNVYRADPSAASLFEEIRAIVQRVIQQRVTQSAAQQKERRLKKLLASVTEGPNAVLRELHQLHEERKAKVVERLVRVMENDVKADINWIESMEEAERPPLLPIPEPMSYVSAADVAAWKDVRAQYEELEGNPFEKKKRKFQPTLFGQAWKVPDKPLLFWGTGVTAVQQALRSAAEDAERNRQGEPLVPPYPCPENPWGWRLAKDILDD